MLRTTVCSLTRSSTVAAPEPRTGHHATASAMVHLHFQTRICSETGGAEGGGEEGGSTETLAVHVLHFFMSSVIVTRSSLRTREEIMEHVRRHFSDHECGLLLGWADHVAVEMCDLILQPGNGRAALEEFREDVDGDLEDPTEDMTEAQEEMDLVDDLEELAVDYALFGYEAVAAPPTASAATLTFQIEFEYFSNLILKKKERKKKKKSKHAAARLAQRLPSSPSPPSSPPASSSSVAADVLPEVLRHSLPLKTDRPSSLSTLSAHSKWSLPNSSDPSSRRSLDAVNPLRAFVSLPPVTFGPRRLGAFLGLI
ncbi:hypothetical protein EJ110_NYTH54952 [Nymphaea thermarum]|nr:hypothetical protein EJ110_NYTH54952 [Nymphaea thermarum]